MKDKQRKERKMAMRAIGDEIEDLTGSPLYLERKKNGVYPVLGEGSLDAEIIFIGEAPGKNESESGRPFCGASGKVLDRLLESIGLAREDVYITNVVKDRPPANRDPLPGEVDIYAPFLDRQIEIIEPRVIVPLGRHAMKYIFKRYKEECSKLTISEAHGKEFRVRFSYGDVSVIPFFHPAVAVYDANKMDGLKTDFRALKSFI